MNGLMSAAFSYFSKPYMKKDVSKHPQSQHTDWFAPQKITMVTLITAFALYHGYKTWNSNKTKTLHENQRKNRMIQNKLRRAQHIQYIKDEEIFISGYLRSSGIYLFIPMDILQTIILFCERRPFIHEFTSNNQMHAHNFVNNKVFCSPTYNFNGFKCDVKLYPNGIKKKNRHRGYVQIGMRIISIPFNIESVTVFYEFYDSNRFLQHHDVTVLNKNDINSAFIWKLDTKKDAENIFEYKCHINVIKMEYYDGYKYENEKIEINKEIIYKFDLYEEGRKSLKYFHSIKDNGQYKTYMMESINSNAFGINKNWSLRFVKSRVDNRKIMVYLKLLNMPNKIGKIVVDCILKNKIRKMNQKFTYRNNKLYFFSQTIPEICDGNISDMYYPVGLKIVIIKVYDNECKLVDSHNWSKYGVIQNIF